MTVRRRFHFYRKALKWLASAHLRTSGIGRCRGGLCGRPRPWFAENCRKLACSGDPEWLAKRVPRIGNLIAAAVARPSAGNERKLRKIGQPLVVRWPGRCWRSACEIGQGYGPGTSGLRTFVDEAEKREFSLGIVVNILRHMHVESQQVSVNSGFPAAA